MGNFKIVFACRMRDGSKVPYERIIAVSDIAMARRVAYAMIGERIDDDQTLDAVVYFIPTAHCASVARTPDGYYALWGRVLDKLGIDPHTVRLWFGREIGLGTNPTGHIIPSDAQVGEPEIVGFYPYPPAST